MVGGGSQIGADALAAHRGRVQTRRSPMPAFNASGALQSRQHHGATGITIITTGSTAGNVVAVGPGASGPPVLLQFQPNGMPFAPFTSPGALSGEVVVQPAPEPRIN